MIDRVTGRFALGQMRIGLSASPHPCVKSVFSQQVKSWLVRHAGTHYKNSHTQYGTPNRPFVVGLSFAPPENVQLEGKLFLKQLLGFSRPFPGGSPAEPECSTSREYPTSENPISTETGAVFDPGCNGISDGNISSMI